MTRTKLWLALSIVALGCDGGGGTTGVEDPPNVAGTWSGTVFRETDTCPAGNSGLSTSVGMAVQTSMTIAQSDRDLTIIWQAEGELLTGTIDVDGSFNTRVPNTDPVFLTLTGDIAGNRLTAVGIHRAVVNDGTGISSSAAAV